MKPIRQYFDWSFAGAFPEIQTTDELIAELSRGDSDPMFITLPIAQNGAYADDGLHYSEAFNTRLAQLINEQRPTGNMGHLRTEDRGSVFDVPAVIWLQAQFDDIGRLWAKAYVLPNDDIRQFIRASKATRRGIATSIYGFSDPALMHFKADGSYEIEPNGFELESLDLAPIERAALKIDRPLVVTTHMETEETMKLTPELLQQMTVEDAVNLPEPVRQSIVAQFETEITKLKQDVADVVQMNNDLKAQLAERDNQLFDSQLEAAINEAVPTDDEHGTLVEALANATVAHLSGKRDIAVAKAFIANYVSEAKFKNLTAVVIKNMTGGDAIVTSHNTDKPVKTLGEQYEERLDEILNRKGIVLGK